MPGDKPGYEVIQVARNEAISDDKYMWLSQTHGIRAVCQEGKKLRQQYNHFAYGWLESDFILTQRILADFGLEFKIDELKLLLYWYWC